MAVWPLYGCLFNKAHMRIVLLILVFFSANGWAQELNKVDANGLKQGPWEKYYPNSDQLRYQGQFKDDKEVGTFKFYCEDCKGQPTAVREFATDGTAQTIFYNKKGSKLSEGRMKGKNRIGQWKFYEPRTGLMVSEEEYNAQGQLDGLKKTYYANRQLTEELTYVAGKRQGPNKFYSEEGVLIKELNYSNDELHGPGLYYDGAGNLTIKGQYVRGKKHGLWKYYKNGVLELEEVYPKPRPKRGQ